MTQTQTYSRTENKPDALAMLAGDHQKVKRLFADYLRIPEGESNLEMKRELALQICQELTIHAQLEEELAYPAIRAAIEDDEMMDEAEYEHAEAKGVIAELEVMEPSDDDFDEKVSELREMISHHVQEEEDGIFAKVEKTGLDTAALGEQLAELKKDLMDEMEMAEPLSHNR